MAEIADSVAPWQRMLSACVGSLVTSAAMTPLDVVKVKIQAQGQSALPTAASCSQCSQFTYTNGLMEHIVGKDCEPYTKLFRVQAERPRMIGTWRALVHTIKYDGVRGLYAGLPPTLLMAVPSTVLYFTCYDELKYHIERRNPPQFVAPLLAGVIARSLATMVISPLELIRTSMQANKRAAGTTLEAVMSVVRHSGVRGLYAGLAPTLLRDVPFSALYWVGLEAFRDWMNGSDRGGDATASRTFMVAFVSGAVSGSIASVVTLPLDVIKTQRQVFFFTAPSARSPADSVRYATTWSTLRHIVAQHGVAGLFAGVVPRVTRVAPACAIMIGSYDLGKWWFSAGQSVAAVDVPLSDGATDRTAT